MHHHVLTGLLIVLVLIRFFGEILGEVLIEPDLDLPTGSEPNHVVVDVDWALPLEDDLEAFEGLLEDVVGLGQRDPEELGQP